MQIPESAIISKEERDRLIREGKEHIQVCDGGVALHIIVENGVFNIVDEMTTADLQFLPTARKA